jgi:hypothetical protein
MGRYQRFGGIYCFYLQVFSRHNPEEEEEDNTLSETLVPTCQLTWRYDPKAKTDIITMGFHVLWTLCQYVIKLKRLELVLK